MQQSILLKMTLPIIFTVPLLLVQVRGHSTSRIHCRHAMPTPLGKIQRQLVRYQSKEFEISNIDMIVNGFLRIEKIDLKLGKERGNFFYFLSNFTKALREHALINNHVINKIHLNKDGKYQNFIKRVENLFRMLSYFVSRDLITLMRFFAQLQVRPSKDTIEYWFERSRNVLFQFDPQDFSNSLWVLARLRIHPGEEWINAWFRASLARQQLNDFIPQNLSNSLWALAKLGIHPEEKWKNAWLRVSERQINDFTPHGLSTSFWALAKLGIHPEEKWKNAWLRAFKRQFNNFTRHDFSNIRWALGKLGMRLEEEWIY